MKWAMWFGFSCMKHCFHIHSQSSFNTYVTNCMPKLLCGTITCIPWLLKAHLYIINLPQPPPIISKSPKIRDCHPSFFLLQFCFNDKGTLYTRPLSMEEYVGQVRQIDNISSYIHRLVHHRIVTMKTITTFCGIKEKEDQKEEATWPKIAVLYYKCDPEVYYIKYVMFATLFTKKIKERGTSS